MTDDQIRIAIAEAQGWKQCSESVAGRCPPHGIPPNPSWPGERGDIPDYCNDLNAMHEVEGVIWNEVVSIEGREYSVKRLWGEYKQHLKAICQIANCPAIRATARQRAEAYLRTIGRWKDMPATPKEVHAP
jgi:hypothetical protein